MINATFNNISVISWWELVVLYIITINNSTSTTSTKDYVRGCTISTKYWPPSTTSWRLCQRLYYLYQILVLLLPNTDHPQQVEGYVRDYTISTKYWPPPTSWRLCQRLYYFYQILTTPNKLKVMSEIVLLLPNTDHLQQLEDYVRGCTKYWPPPTKWRLYQRLFYFYQILITPNKLKIMSEIVLLLPNTDHLQQLEEDYVRGCTKYWPPPTKWRLCQRLFYFYQILITPDKLKIISEIVLLLPNTDHLQQVEDSQDLRANITVYCTRNH